MAANTSDMGWHYLGLPNEERFDAMKFSIRSVATALVLAAVAVACSTVGSESAGLGKIYLVGVAGGG